jgi:hypothetical protein
MSTFSTIMSSMLLDIQRSQQFMDTLEVAVQSIVDNSNRSHGGSRQGKRKNRDRHAGAEWQKFVQSYWGTDTEEPTYTEEHFRRRFRMSRAIFLVIHDAVVLTDPSFRRQSDCTGRVGISSYLKVAGCVQYMCIGIAHDQHEYLFGISESTLHGYYHKFLTAMLTAFQAEYLRLPNLRETDLLSRRNSSRGLPGCIGSIDCMHWEWGRCPMAEAGMYKGKGPRPSVVLEAVADLDYRIWHASFGMPGSVNDITISERSPLVNALAEGSFPPSGFRYTLGGADLTRPYFLADGIYPLWPIFLKTVRNPQSQKERLVDDGSHFPPVFASISITSLLTLVVLFREPRIAACHLPIAFV